MFLPEEYASIVIHADAAVELNFTAAIEARLMADNPPLAHAITSFITMQPTYRGGIYPFRTFTSWPSTEDRRTAIHRPCGWMPGTWPPTDLTAGKDPQFMEAMQLSYDYAAGGPGTPYNGPYQVSNAQIETVYSSGVWVRSLEEGTDEPQFPKQSYAACTGACATGITPAGSVCNMQTYKQCPPGMTCNADGRLLDTRCGSGQSRWTMRDQGCMF